MSKKLNKSTLKSGIKTVFTGLKAYRREVWLLTVLSLFTSVTTGLIPFLIGRLIDAIRSPAIYSLGPWLIPTVFFLLGLWLIVQLVTYLISWLGDGKILDLGTRLYADYIVKSYANLLALPISFHKTHKLGEITNKINLAATALEEMVAGVIFRLAPQFLSIITALLIVFWLQPKLALLMLLGLAVYLVIFLSTVKPMADLQFKNRRGWNRAFGNAYDAVNNAKAVKEATTEDRERLKMHRDFRQRATRAYLNFRHLWQNLNLSQRLTILGTQLLIFVYSILLIRSGGMTIGELVSFNSYAALIFGPFTTLANQWVTIQNGLITLNFAEKILATRGEQYWPEGQLKIKSFNGDVVFRNLNFYYEKDKPILRNINFTIRAGEVVALVGESGVGKSTLIDLISGYHFARRGQVLIDGNDIRKLPLTLLRSQIAVVPQEVVLFNDTIKTNIKYGNFRADDQALELAARRAHALDFIEKFPKKWKQVVGERGIKLSVGQKQRVAIARAILRDPKILILDEPTSALDAQSEHIIKESLEELMRGRTTFIIAHRLSTVRQADKILVFKNGEIVESGKHDELIEVENGVYRHLYELQIGLHQ